MMPFHIPGDQLQRHNIDKNGIKINIPADHPEFIFRIILK